MFRRLYLSVGFVLLGGGLAQAGTTPVAPPAKNIITATVVWTAVRAVLDWRPTMPLGLAPPAGAAKW